MIGSARQWGLTGRIVLVTACAWTVALPEAVAQAPAAPARALPSALLSIDQNRTTVIDRIATEWGDALEQSGANLGGKQLREMLAGLRADQLLAASLAGSLSGLREVLSNGLAVAAPTVPSRRQIKQLGDVTQDLVYTPTTPCRLFDTRVSQGGLGTPALNVRRTYGATAPVANQGGTVGCVADQYSTVALIQVGTLTPNGSGLLQAGPQGVASFPNALILYQAGQQYGTSVAMPLNVANGQFDLVEQFATADLYGDLLGYFEAPALTSLYCTQVDSPGTSIAVSSDTSVPLPICTAGFVRTGSSCSGTANVPSGYVIETNAISCVFRNLSAAVTYNGTATSTCCIIPGHP